MDKTDEFKELMENYKLGFVSANTIITTFVDMATSEGPKVDTIAAMVEEKRNELLVPLADKIVSLLTD